MNRDEFVSWMNQNSGADGFDDAMSFFKEYSSDNDSYRESSEARFNEFTTSEQQMRESIESLKARNYDLLMQVPSGKPLDNEVDETGEVFHIDSLFKNE